MTAKYRYFEREGAYYRSKVEAGWIEDVWTPTGWQPYTGDRGKPVWFGDRISERDFALAIDLARRLHDAETFRHVARVVGRVADRVADRRAMIVAALHDAVEDTPITVAVIEKIFGRDIGDAVAAISRTKTENYLTDYIPRVAANEMARFVKIADIDDHLFLTETLTPEKKERYERAREVLLAPRPVSERAFQIIGGSR